MIDQRCDPGLDAHHVGVHAEASCYILVDMRMGIDQSGQHQLAGDIDNLLGAGWQNVGLNCGDLAVANRDVLHAVDV